MRNTWYEIFEAKKEREKRKKLEEALFIKYPPVKRLEEKFNKQRELFNQLKDSLIHKMEVKG